MRHQYSSGDHDNHRAPHPVHRSAVALSPRYEDRIPGLQLLTLETLEGEQAALKLLRWKAQSITSER